MFSKAFFARKLNVGTGKRLGFFLCFLFSFPCIISVNIRVARVSIQDLLDYCLLYPHYLKSLAKQVQTLYKLSEHSSSIFTICLTLSQTSPGSWFSHVCSTSLLKTPWKKELIMSNFSSSHSVFYPFGELSAIFIKSQIVICKLFQFGTG